MLEQSSTLDTADVKKYRLYARGTVVGPAGPAVAGGGGVRWRLGQLFLPAGYPHSVSDDYFTFQFWDSVQAACSYVRCAQYDFVTDVVHCLFVVVGIDNARLHVHVHVIDITGFVLCVSTSTFFCPSVLPPPPSADWLCRAFPCTSAAGHPCRQGGPGRRRCGQRVGDGFCRCHHVDPSRWQWHAWRAVVRVVGCFTL